MMFHTVIFTLISLILCAHIASADITAFSYKTHNPRSRKVSEEFTLTIHPPEKGHTLIQRTLKTDAYTKTADMVVDGTYDTVSFTTTQTNEETDYRGEREGRTLKITGKLKGEELNRVIELDDKPFYFTPKFNLTHFVLSDQEEIQFWTLRKDELTEYVMEAKKDGTKTFDIDGQTVEAIRVQYSATGKFAKFYRRTYFFRASDGLFISKKSPDGTISELISE